MYLFDKPIGISSFRVVAIVRKTLNIKRVGHAGTLDPLASGLLIVLVGREETKLQDTLMHQPKVYEVTLALGTTSTTDDAEGDKTIMTPVVNVSLEQIKTSLQQFVGEIQQRPPIYSAIHVQGQRAYQLARRGEQFQLPSRLVTIQNIEVLAYTAPVLSLRVHCSHGTYIRSLVRDLGEALGCGAYMTGLRRTAIGTYRVGDAIACEPAVILQTPPWTLK